MHDSWYPSSLCGAVPEYVSLLYINLYSKRTSTVIRDALNPLNWTKPSFYRDMAKCESNIRNTFASHPALSILKRYTFFSVPSFIPGAMEYTMPEKTTRYLMFGLLYFSQGTILSYFTALNALYLLDNGLKMSDIGLFAAIALIPFVIKIFLGMLSDKINLLGLGYRKPYILIGLLVQVLCLIIVPFINPAQNYWWFVALAFILQMGMALYDTCTDGLALDTTPESEKGTVQSVMVGGRAAGVVITASAVGLLAQNVSWLAVFWLLAIFTLLPIPLVLSIKESERPVERAFNWRAFKAFTQKQVLTLAVVGLLIFMIIAGTNQNVNPFLETQFGISLSMAGLYTTIWGLGVIGGGAAGGTLITKMGDQKATLTSLIVAFCGILILAVIPNPALAFPLVFLFGVVYGTYQTVYFSLAMRYTDPRIAASMFAILMAFTNVGQGIGMAIAGVSAEGIGFRLTFVILGVLNLVAIPLLPLIFKVQKGKD
jgi:PAT family beta-lactamase induction signal transducer AmpG